MPRDDAAGDADDRADGVATGGGGRRGGDDAGGGATLGTELGGTAARDDGGSLQPAASESSAIDAIDRRIYPCPPMPLDLSTVGAVTETSSFAYDAKTLSLYALGIGAKRDELDYLYEGRGPKVYPTFAVVPTLGVVFSQLSRTGAELAMVVHGAQSVTIRAALPAAATLRTTGSVKGIYDLKRFAQIVLTTTTTLEDGTPAFDTEWSIIVRGAGGFGGSPPPKREDAVSIPKDRAPDFRFEEATTPEQALLYRLSGDFNPLHADPEVATAVGFPQGPILHGLCTYGFAARAFAKSAHGGDASRIKRMDSQFRKPVWPGDTLVTECFRNEGRVVFQMLVKERNEQVATGAFWEALRRRNRLASGRRGV